MFDPRREGQFLDFYHTLIHDLSQGLMFLLLYYHSVGHRTAFLGRQSSEQNYKLHRKEYFSSLGFFMCFLMAFGTLL